MQKKIKKSKWLRPSYQWTRNVNTTWKWCKNIKNYLRKFKGKVGKSDCKTWKRNSFVYWWWNFTRIDRIQNFQTQINKNTDISWSYNPGHEIFYSEEKSWENRSVLALKGLKLRTPKSEIKYNKQKNLCVTLLALCLPYIAIGTGFHNGMQIYPL